MSNFWFCGSSAGCVDFEASSRQKLVDKIADYYADGYAGPDESKHPPEYADVGFTSGSSEEWLTAEERAGFNADVQEAFEAAIEGWDQPSDYEEHNTHWKGSAI